MAKAYLEKLSLLVAELDLSNRVDATLQVKHYFNGAALYADQLMCASWSPAGLAFKLPEPQVSELIASGKARPLKYFQNGHVKKGYAVFEHPEVKQKESWQVYFLTAIEHL